MKDTIYELSMQYFVRWRSISSLLSIVVSVYQTTMAEISGSYCWIFKGKNNVRTEFYSTLWSFTEATNKPHTALELQKKFACIVANYFLFRYNMHQKVLNEIEQLIEILHVAFWEITCCVCGLHLTCLAYCKFRQHWNLGEKMLSLHNFFLSWKRLQKIRLQDKSK